MRNDFAPLSQAFHSFFEPARNVFYVDVCDMTHEEIQTILTRIQGRLHGELEEGKTPTHIHEDLYAVEEISTFRNMYLVRALSAEEAIDRVETDGEDFEFLQTHVGSHYPVAWGVHTDNDIVNIYRMTENPNMTPESFARNDREQLLKNLINE